MTYPTFDPTFPARAVKELAKQADLEALELAADLLSTSSYGFTLNGIVTAHSAIASLSTSTTNSISGVALNVTSLSTNLVSVASGVVSAHSAVASLSTQTSTIADVANTALVTLNTEIVNTNISLNTHISNTTTSLQTVRSQVASLSTVVSSGLSTTNSNVNSLSTGLSNTRASVASLSTATPRQFGATYTKTWVGTVTTSTSTAVFNISSAAFTNIVGIFPSAFLNGSTVLNAPLCSISARSNSSITVHLLESKTARSAESLEYHAVAGTEVYLLVLGN